MRKPHLAIIIFLITFVQLLAFGQSPRFNSYTSIPGHRKLDVKVISQDKDGYMWFGTKNGLIRFDGSEFEDYGKKYGLADGSISAFIQDSLGNLWIGHPSGQISVKKGERFEVFDPEEGLPVVEISSLFIDALNTLWFTTMGEGVYYYSGVNRKRLYNLSSDDGLTDNYVYHMVQDTSGLFYFATDKGVTIYDGNKKQLVNTLSMSDGLPDNIVTHLLIKDQVLWIGMYEGGLSSYDIGNDSLTVYGDWPFSAIQDFVVSENGELMVSTKKHGIIQCSFIEKEINYNRLNKDNNLASDRTATVICDREKNIWVGTSKGISVRKNHGIEFLDASTGFDVRDVYGITLDKKGNYWIASQGGLFYSYPKYDGEIQTEKFDIPNLHDNSELSFISIYCDTEGYIWAGTYGYGVYCIGPEGEVKNFNQKNGFLNENIIHINGHEQYIWLSSLGGGVIQLDKSQDHKVTTYSTQNGLASDYVYSTYIDNKGNVWCATDGGGVSIIKDGEVEAFDTNYFQHKVRAVYTITEDVYGNMWFNSPEFGLIKKDSIGYHHMSDSTIYINGSLVGVASTKYEIVAVSDELIDKYNLTHNQKVQLGEDELVANQKPNLNALYIDSLDNIWIGTANGIIKLNHVAINEAVKPLLSINQVSLFFKPHDKSFSKFHHKQNHLTFDYNALWFKEHDKLKYRYQLQGFDIDWTETSTMKRVTYSNLPSGDYEFIVQVNYPGGDWIETSESKFKFSIALPFWKRTWFVILVLISVIAFVVWVIRYRTQKLIRDKKLLEDEVIKRTAEIQSQKEEIEAQRDEIEKQHGHVVEQRDEIEHQNKNITASIQYASRIQNALLPPLQLFDENLNDYFVFFRPRDIVSGDFYFAMKVNDDFVIAAADCTGHGVPGAFMSVLSISLLKQILGQDNCTCNAAQILDELRELVKKALGQTGKADEAKDGLDISLCVISENNNTIQFAGAYNPLMVVRNNEIIEIKGDKMPIGIYQFKDLPFTNQTFDTQKGDMLYLYSDGLQDQFGGDKSRKFLPKRLRELLIKASSKPMNVQNKMLDKAFVDWKGDEHQVDDILVIGIKC